MLSAGFLGLAAMAGALAGLPAGIRLSDHNSLGVIASAPGRRGQRWWQMPPLAAGAHEVEEAIQQPFAYPWSAAAHQAWRAG